MDKPRTKAQKNTPSYSRKYGKRQQKNAGNAERFVWQKESYQNLKHSITYGKKTPTDK